MGLSGPLIVTCLVSFQRSMSLSDLPCFLELCWMKALVSSRNVASSAPSNQVTKHINSQKVPAKINVEKVMKIAINSANEVSN